MDSLATFVYGELHRQVLKRRREWFELMHEAYTACWWVPVGQRPTTADAEERILHLREHGPTPYAFTLRESFAAPTSRARRTLGPETPTGSARPERCAGERARHCSMTASAELGAAAADVKPALGTCGGSSGDTPGALMR